MSFSKFMVNAVVGLTTPEFDYIAATFVDINKAVDEEESEVSSHTLEPYTFLWVG